MISNIEYVLLRLLRRWVFQYEFLLKFGRYIPYYKTNYNQVNPEIIVNKYFDYLKKKGINYQGKNILEIGVGATNSTGYEIIKQLKGNGSVFQYEPFVKYDERQDIRLINDKKYDRIYIEKVKRINSLKQTDKKFDLILSHSVLEHVPDPSEVFSELSSVLSSDGYMLHLVDYRDHFFKYPYHFLTFRAKTWNYFLNPGDLPRWRLSDHLDEIEKQGFRYSIIEIKKDEQQLQKTDRKILNYFKNKKFWDVTYAAILVFR